MYLSSAASTTSQSDHPSISTASMTTSLDGDLEDLKPSPPRRSSSLISSSSSSLISELWASTDWLFQTRLTWLLPLGPLAAVGGATGVLGPATCFGFAGLALIPCAERLSYITELVAEHTNGTIGALLNATFGNAPELLISIAALRAGFYRVVQLAMLGSILTNLIFVFGVACFVGGIKWNVQELRITSGNVNVIMLFLATAGSLLPAVLIESGQLSSRSPAHYRDNNNVPTQEEITFCRVNSAVMLILYLCYLVFQLGTHKEEFDDFQGSSHSNKNNHHTARRARRNLFCLRHMSRAHSFVSGRPTDSVSTNILKAKFAKQHQYRTAGGRSLNSMASSVDLEEQEEQEPLISDHDPESEGWSSPNEEKSRSRRRRKMQHFYKNGNTKPTQVAIDRVPAIPSPLRTKRSKSDTNVVEIDDDDSSHDRVHSDRQGGPEMSMRVGIVWLFIITLCISAMSDILVDTIDDFARRLNMSDVFVSSIVIPFFSNVAEQVSAFLFAYRNEMDLCVGVTVGSAIQIATLVLPGSVLIGALMDRSMTLYFRAYETVCLCFGVVVVGAILQGGTTNWLVGAILVGIYVMMAAGVWFHELEDLSSDAELLIRNVTSS